MIGARLSDFHVSTDGGESDTIALSDTGFAGFAQVYAASSQVGADVAIQFLDQSTLTLRNFVLADLREEYVIVF